MRLETNRLALMPVQFTDGTDMFMAVKESLAELSPWMPWAQQGYGLRHAQEFIAEAIRRIQAKEKWIFMMRAKSSGRLIGLVELAHTPDIYGNSVPMFEVGYWVRSGEVGQGYATEAVKRVVDYAFKELEARRVFATTAGRNESSQKVLLGAGLEREAVLRNERMLVDGSVDNSVFFAKVI